MTWQQAKIFDLSVLHLEACVNIIHNTYTLHSIGKISLSAAHKKLL